jgi:hypothetical protein
MNDARKQKLLFVALFVPLIVSAFAGLVLPVRSAREVHQMAEGPVPWPPTGISGGGNG